MFHFNDFSVKNHFLCLLPLLFMEKNIDHLNLQKISTLAKEQDAIYVDDNLYITTSIQGFALQNLRRNQPYRVEEGRVLCVSAGWVRCLINLETFNLEEHSAVIVLPNSTFEVLERSEDFDFFACSFPTDLPIIAEFNNQIDITLDDEEWSLINEYFNLMWHEVKRKPVLPEVLLHLQMAMMMELCRINKMSDVMRDIGQSREYATLHHFIRLVNEYGKTHRNIPFYADKLCLTPNHFGAVIKHASGLTAMQWINRFIIQQAKVLLKYGDNSILGISEQLNFPNPSFFSKFFKRETGMTPNEYRRQLSC